SILIDGSRPSLSGFALSGSSAISISFSWGNKDGLGPGESVCRVEVLLAGVFLRLLVGMVARAHKRAAFDHAKADAQAKLLPMVKLLRRRPARHGEVLRCRLQVLADRQDVGLIRCDVADRLLDFRLRFTEAKHDARLRHEPAAFGVSQHGP